MMKLSVLVAVAVLLLELTTAQAAAPATSGRPEIVRSSLLEKKGQPHLNTDTSKAFLLDPALEGRDLPPPSEDPESEDQMSLQSRQNLLWWKTWNGRGNPPCGSVNIHNKHTRRTDYVCRVGCVPGFYTASKGPYCYYPYGGKEYRSRSFKILFYSGKYTVGFLKWRSGSFGSTPANSVLTCSDIFVAKNRYGLGKVHGKHRAFFLPWNGQEYWYKWYDVLTIND